jgi:hypothetical protein
MMWTTWMSTLQRLAALLLASLGLRLAAEGTMVEMLQSTCRITHEGRSGTGFFVQREKQVFLVTAAHVFEESRGPECRLILREKAAGPAGERRELPVPVRKEGKPLWKRHAKEDVAAIPVELPPEIDAVPLPFDRVLRPTTTEASRVHVGQDVYLPGYPAQLEANPAGWPVLRRGMIASHPLSPVPAVPTMIVDIQSFGGDSGAPLFAVVQGSPHLAGMVVGMHRQTDRSVSPFEERTVHTPLGLAIAVQAAVVIRTLEQFEK